MDQIKISQARSIIEEEIQFRSLVSDTIKQQSDKTGIELWDKKVEEIKLLKQIFNELVEENLKFFYDNDRP